MGRVVLVLGGTGEARELAGMLAAQEGLRVVSSLAGRVGAPHRPGGEVRVGGFGGPGELARWLTDHDAAAVIDATHPFATRITVSAARATSETGVPFLMVRRPGWRPRAGADWHWTTSLQAAAGLLGDTPALGERVFLTTGRQELAPFAGLAGHWFLLRSVEPPAPPLPPRHRVLLDRGPFTLTGELALLREHRIEVLVTKDSGGGLTRAKLDAAHELGVPVVIVRRPPAPEGPAVATVGEALAWLRGVL